jgi:hypothetical protein
VRENPETPQAQEQILDSMRQGGNHLTRGVSVRGHRSIGGEKFKNPYPDKGFLVSKEADFLHKRTFYCENLIFLLTKISIYNIYRPVSREV